MKMKFRSTALLTLAMALAFAPAALADSFIFSVTNPGNSAIFSFGTLSGNEISTGVWDITSGTITVGGTSTPLSGSGSLIPNPKSPGTDTIRSGSGKYNITYDDQLTPGAMGSIPYVDNAGLLFWVNGTTDLNIFSNSPFTGAGTNDYVTWVDSNGYSGSGEFNVAPVVPEPPSLLLLGTGLLGMAFLLFRRKGVKPVSHSVLSA